MDLTNEYKKRIAILEGVVDGILEILKRILNEYPRIDSIKLRVKDADSFVAKANLKLDDGVTPKYRDPLIEIQDQVGARVVTYYLSDVEPVTKILLSEFREIENARVIKDEPSQFGYEGRHIICFIPEELKRRYVPPIDFFEIQIHTLFQHSWAQANHDLGYKPAEKLEYLEERKVAWAAAQAWGSDYIFDTLWNERKKLVNSSN